MTRKEVDQSSRSTVPPPFAAVAAVALAIGSGTVLGYSVAEASPARLLTLALAFGGLGSGVALARREYPVAAGVGVAALVAFPTIGASVLGPTRPGTLSAVGVAAVGVFLLVRGTEAVLRRPEAVERFASRDALLAVGCGVVVAAAVSLAWHPESVVYDSVATRLLATVVDGARAAFLVAAVAAAVLLFTRRRALFPGLLANAVLATAVSDVGDGHTLWGATPEYLATEGLVLLVLVLAAGLLEVGARGAVRQR